MRLKQPGQARAAIPLVPMIDVLMIMLIFFLVTSTYLNLRMIPMAASTDAPETESPISGAVSNGSGAAAPSGTLLIRLDADGRALLRGQPVDHAALARLLTDRLAANPALNVVLLPSGRASTQNLVTLLDTTTSAGVRRLRVVRLGEGQ